MYQSFAIQSLLIWAALVAGVLSAIMAPNVLSDSRIPSWRRTAYVVVLGPPFWAVLAIALLVSLGMFLSQAEKRRRGKVAKT